MRILNNVSTLRVSVALVAFIGCFMMGMTRDGHLTNYVDAPNRYGLPAFYELHVWAWEHKHNGSFADWNTHVSCDSQPPQ